MAPHEVGFSLSGILLSALDYANPREAFKNLSGARDVIEGGDR